LNKVLADLLHLLRLEQLEVNLFRGESRDIGSPQVFGGQVLGQALRAASETVDPQRKVHSLHAYFLRRGDFDAPIVYQVDRSRDGGAFTSRRVVAIQHGQQIFHMAASFQVEEQGLSHQVTAPVVPAPDVLPDFAAVARKPLDRLSDMERRYWSVERPFEFRSVESFESGERAPPVRHFWFRLVEQCPGDDPVLQNCLFAYLSDYHLLSTALQPHGLSFSAGKLTMASIDHAMWFHRPSRIDQWHLYALESPSSSGARGFANGRIFDQQGRLVASTAQEGLMRVGSK